MAGIAFDGGLTAAYRVRDRRAAAAWSAGVLGFELLYDAEQVGCCGMRTHIPGLVRLATFFVPDGNHLMSAQSPG